MNTYKLSQTRARRAGAMQMLMNVHFRLCRDERSELKSFKCMSWSGDLVSLIVISIGVSLAGRNCPAAGSMSAHHPTCRSEGAGLEANLLERAPPARAGMGRRTPGGWGADSLLRDNFCLLAIHRY
jgi:hypothetical protein